MKKIMLFLLLVMVAVCNATAGEMKHEQDSVIIPGYIGLCIGGIVPDTFSLNHTQSEYKLSLYLMQYAGRPDETLPRTRKRLGCDVVEATLIYDTEAK